MFLRRALPIFALSVLSTFATAQQSVAPTTEGPHPAIAANYGKLPLSFEANAGQSDRAAKFLARGNGYAVFLTDKEAVLALSKGEPRRAAVPGKPVAQAAAKTDVVRLQLAGANSGLKVSGEEQLPGTANYFIGNDPAKWQSNVPTYAKVRYAAVYPGVDLVYYGSQRQLEYDFVVAPGADAGQVRLRFAGAERLNLSSNGDLTVTARHGEISFHKPVVYQASGGKRVEVEGRFELLAGNNVGFSLGSYDKGRELVIDPVLEYSTYLGGTGSDVANAITVDTQGNAYLTGHTQSAKFPISGTPLQAANGDTTQGDAFVTKINPTGTGLVYSTYLGGSGVCSSFANEATPGDDGNAIAVDASGAAYIAGQTCSTDFPIKGAYQSVNKGSAKGVSNAFVTKISSNGGSLVYSTYLGGSGNPGGGFSFYSGDYALGIAVDSEGEAYVGGGTWSNDFPVTSGALETTSNAYPTDSGFITKLSSSGSSLVYSTYLGGNYGNTVAAIAIDSTGDAYVTGYAQNTSFPVTANAYQPTNAFGQYGVNAIVSELNPAGNKLLYSTYLGGSSGVTGDNGSGIAVDSSGNVYVAGYTHSHDFPTLNAYQPKDLAPSGTFTGFVSKINTVSGALVYSTYLGGSGGDAVNGIQIDAKGNAYVTGYTYSYASTGTSPTTGFPVTSGAYQAVNNAAANKGSNAFFTEINPVGSALVYSTYLGGSGQGTNGDGANGLALGSDGSVYLAGYANSLASFPHTNAAFQTKSNATAGNSNAFVAKFAFQTASAVSLVADGNPQKFGVKVTFTADVTGQALSGTPTGTVGFSVDGGTAVNVAVDSTGHAAYARTTLTAGVHKVVASYSGDATHLASTSNTLSETIYGPAATIAVVSGTPQSGVYGAAFGAPLVVVVKDSAGDVVPGATITFSGAGLKFSSTTVTTGANGQASVTATAVAAGSLTATAAASGITKTVTFALTAAKAVLKVTATNVSVKYGAAVPALTYTVTGYVNGDTSSVVTGAPTETTTAKQGSAAGTYPITLAAGTLAATNYSFTLLNGTVTITSLGVTAEPGATQVITIADATNGAKVYYTTDGSTPTTSSTLYTGPITITKTQTLKFIAVAPGYSPSPVRTVADTVQ